MSLVKTAKEWIEDLQKLKPCTKLVGNLYSAGDLRKDIERDLCTAQNADELTDDEVIERFRTEYDDNENDVYYNSLSTIASNIDVDYEEEHDDDDDHTETQADPSVCKKLLVGLYDSRGLIFEEIVYPGFMDALDLEDITKMNEAIDFAAADDPDHPDLIVTDDIACLAERMCQEWGEGHGRYMETCSGETCVAKALDNMVEGVIKADRIRIDGGMFNAKDGQYIVAERYTKDIVYTEQTNEFMKKIGKELKK